MDFVDLARDCAPQLEVSVLAAIVSLQSDFRPFAIGINSDHPLASQPQSKPEAIEIATILAAEGLNLDLGLAGVNISHLARLGISLADAFDPCVNLQVSAQLLTEFRALAVQRGSRDPDGDMLFAFRVRASAQSGTADDYEQEVMAEAQRLRPILGSIALAARAPEISVQLADSPSTSGNPALVQTQPIALAEQEAGPNWDVFHAGQKASVLVFTNH